MLTKDTGVEITEKPSYFRKTYYLEHRNKDNTFNKVWHSRGQSRKTDKESVNEYN